MTRSRMFARLSVIIMFVCLSAICLAQKHVEYPVHPIPPHTLQELLLLFTGDSPQERILLTLNNNRPGNLTATIAAYTSAGERVLLPDIELIPQESKLIELAPILRNAGLANSTLGWLQVTYSGVVMELGAQLTTYPVANGSGVDSPRSLSGDFKSARRSATFWMPELGTARIALTNISAGPISATLTCNSITKKYLISSKTTRIHTLSKSKDEHAGPESCDLVSDWAS